MKHKIWGKRAELYGHFYIVIWARHFESISMYCKWKESTSNLFKQNRDYWTYPEPLINDSIVIGWSHKVLDLGCRSIGEFQDVICWLSLDELPMFPDDYSKYSKGTAPRPVQKNKYSSAQFSTHWSHHLRGFMGPETHHCRFQRTEISAKGETVELRGKKCGLARFPESCYFCLNIHNLKSFLRTLIPLSSLSAQRASSSLSPIIPWHSWNTSQMRPRLQRAGD